MAITRRSPPTPLVALVATMAIAACSPAAPDVLGLAPSLSHQPRGWDHEVALARPVDLDPDPHILEVNLEAAVSPRQVVPGTMTPTWAYNGQIPGPLLRAHAGDRIVVHFVNHLPEATTMHWHGIRLDAAMDGAPMSQPPVEPNGTFDYSFVVPDAGLFWYHPHVRSNVQVASGLYGAILVDEAAPATTPATATAAGPAAPEAAPEAAANWGDEAVLVLSDILVRADGSFPPPGPQDDLIKVFGGEGNTIWVNGKVTPTILARRGLRQRWHIVNAAGSRYFNLELDGQHFVRIGGDGGLREAAIEADRLLLAPGERADVLVTPDAPVGTRLTARWIPYDRGFGSTEGRVPVDVFHVLIAADADPALPAPAALPEVLRTIGAVNTGGAHAQDVRFELEDGGARYAINGQTSGTVEFHGTVGETDLWTITNDTPFDHPFHLHGFFFQVLGADQQPLAPREWKDTVNVPQMSTLSLAVNYDNRPGMWMFHCHILDHAELGLMGMLHVH